MAEKDPKKVDEKAGTQTSTVQLSPELTMLLTTLASTAQKTYLMGPAPATDQIQATEFTDKAKEAVEKFNNILAGLQLKPPLTPALNPIAAPTQDKKIQLVWRMPAPERFDTLSGFKIQRAEEPTGIPTGPFMDLPVPLGPEKTSHIEGPLNPGITYHYRVVALTPDRGEFVSNVEKVLIQ